MCLTKPLPKYPMPPARRAPNLSFKSNKTDRSGFSEQSKTRESYSNKHTFKPFLVLFLILGQDVFAQVVDEIRQQLLPAGSPLVRQQPPRSLHHSALLAAERGQEPLDVAGTWGR